MMLLPTPSTPRRETATLGISLGLGLLLVAGVPAPALSSSSSSLLGDAFIETMSTAVGDEGELFNVQAGMHLDLFPDDPNAGWNTVLALDVVREGELAERWVIPGTEGFETESDAAILFEGGQLWVLWMSRADDELSHLDLISFSPGDSSWSDLIEVSGDPLPVKGSPSLAVTRETASLAAVETEEGTELPASESVRTVVHALWWEEPTTGDIGVYYTPIILTDGEYLGWNPVVALSSEFLGAAAGESSEASFAPELLYAAALDRGIDRRSVVVGLPEADSGRLHNLVVRLLPDSLAALAENARSHIVGVGLVLTGGTGSGPDDLVGVAEGARSHIVGVGRVPLHRGVREYVGARVSERILQARDDLPDEPDQAFWEQLARDVWSEVIDSGASLLGNQLRFEDLPCGVLHLGADGLVPAGSEAAESLHQVEFCIASQRPLPETTEAAEHRLLLSEDGSEAVVLWEEDGAIHYRRSDEDGWGPVTSLPNAGLELVDAARILRSEVRLR